MALPRLPAPVARGAAALRDAVAGLGRRERHLALLAALVLVVTAGAVGVHEWTVGRYLRPVGRTVATPFLSYTAPAGWVADAPDAPGRLDASALTGAVHGPGYDCGGERYVRGFAAAALLPTDAGGPADRADRVVRWFAAAAYTAPDGAAPEVTVVPARPVRVRGPDGEVDGALVEAGVHAGAHAGCPATTGTVLALAAPVSGGAAVLLVAGDTEGGPAEPAVTDRAALDAVLATVRLSGP